MIGHFWLMAGKDIATHRDHYCMDEEVGGCTKLNQTAGQPDSWTARQSSCKIMVILALRWLTCNNGCRFLPSPFCSNGVRIISWIRITAGPRHVPLGIIL